MEPIEIPNLRFMNDTDALTIHSLYFCIEEHTIGAVCMCAKFATDIRICVVMGMGGRRGSLQNSKSMLSMCCREIGTLETLVTCRQTPTAK